MPTTPSGTTTNYGIAKWNDGDEPGAVALNNNSDLIDAGIKQALDAASGTGMTQLIYRVQGVAGNATLNVVELFNNTGSTLSGSVAPLNDVADWGFVFTGTPFLNKKVLFETQIITNLGIGETDPMEIRGYASLDSWDSSFITVVTYGADFEPLATVIQVKQYHLWTFTIVD